MLKKIETQTYQSIEQLEEKVKKYKRGYVASAIAMFSSLFLIFGSESIPSSSPTIKNYEKIQTSIIQLEDRLSDIDKYHSSPLYNSTNSLERSIEEYRDNLTSAISGLKKDAKEIENTSEFREYNSKRNLLSLIPFITYITSLFSLVYFGLLSGKKEEKLNERKKNFIFDGNVESNGRFESPEEAEKIKKLLEYSAERDRLWFEYQEILSERRELGIPNDDFYEKFSENIVKIMKRYNVYENYPEPEKSKDSNDEQKNESK